jgi:very-short-patch-repair endonuclease
MTDKRSIGNKRPKQSERDIFTIICKTDIGVEVVKEYRFYPARRWRFDYAIPEHKIAIEVEGGVWTSGRHTRSKGFLGDMEKYNQATLLGWRVFRVIPDELCKIKTLDIIKQAIKF